ncbi:MP18 RNA editing complex protein [Trypanosoma vivax]|nr:MP18 RNA editing complex protein [Trypanosoma vivax]
MMLRKTVARFCKSVNSVTLVGVVHDIQCGFVYEDAVTQFTLTTTSIDTTHPTQEVVVEKDHHTIRCFGELFSAEVKQKIKDGNVVCVNGRLRLSPQLEPSCNKHFYFPYIQVQPPHGQVAVIHGDRRTVPAPVNPVTDEIKVVKEGSGSDGLGSSSQ